MIYTLLILNIILTIILYKKLSNKITTRSFWLRKSIDTASSEKDGDDNEVQKQWNIIFGDKNPDKKTLKIREEILKDLENQ